MSKDKQPKPQKTAGQGLFAQVKQDLGKEMLQAGIEQIYTKGKLTGKFGHPKEVEEQIEIMRQNREEIPVLREKISAKLKREQEVADAENQLSKDYRAMAEHPNQHPKLKQILEQVADLSVAIAGNRYNMHAQISIINEEWKKWETIALKEIRLRQDQLNHCWCEMKFWKKKDNAKYAECDSRYRVLTSEFVSLIHDIRKKKEEEIPTWLLCIAQYELEFFTNTVGKIAHMEQAIRSMGPVQAQEIAGVEKFTLTWTDTPAAVPQLMPPPSAVPPTGGGAFPVESSPRYGSGHTTPLASSTASLAKYRALYDFQSTEDGDLSFHAGEELTVTADMGSGWYQATNAAGRSGLVPANYLSNS